MKRLTPLPGPAGWTGLMEFMVTNQAYGEVCNIFPGRPQQFDLVRMIVFQGAGMNHHLYGVVLHSVGGEAFMKGLKIGKPLGCCCPMVVPEQKIIGRCFKSRQAGIVLVPKVNICPYPDPPDVKPPLHFLQYGEDPGNGMDMVMRVNVAH